MIGVIGLGYVGLPLAVEFGKKHDVIGFDINKSRIAELQSSKDKTLEVSKEDFKLSKNLKFTSEISELSRCNFYIITVPTPVDKNNIPDLSYLESASTLVSKILKKGDIVIYESTVYPGATEEVCVPLLSEGSGLSLNEDFFCGYSPERINPGDKEHRIKDIVKIVSGSTDEATKKINKLYSSIIEAGTYVAESIKVAEAAKVIENTQRDLNIALVNELAIIFNNLNIDTNSVLNAAKTKWNFIPFKPGLVGGHCIGVDPYYLTHKSEKEGYKPKVILSGRKLNDGMGEYIANEVCKILNDNDRRRILILGATFKENCPDIRNTKVLDLINSLEKRNCHVDILDPLADNLEVVSTFSKKLIPSFNDLENQYDAIILAVAHHEFLENQNKLKSFLNKNGIIYDVKGALDDRVSDMRL